MAQGRRQGVLVYCIGWRPEHRRDRLAMFFGGSTRVPRKCCPTRRGAKDLQSARSRREQCSFSAQFAVERACSNLSSGANPSTHTLCAAIVQCFFHVRCERAKSCAAQLSRLMACGSLSGGPARKQSTLQEGRPCRSNQR